MALDKHGKVQYLHEIFFMSRMQNEDDSSAPTVFGINNGYPERGWSRGIDILRSSRILFAEILLIF